jgi:aerobic-type carbon monoxide dehydrogenase small subunit (CoxS/CutS family)
MPSYTFRVNGRAVSVDAWDPDESLLYVLRGALGVHGPKLFLNRRSGDQEIRSFSF